MISKLDERRKWKKVGNEEVSKNYIRLRNELKGTTEKAKKAYLDRICDEVTEFKRIGCCDLMYMKTKEVGWRENERVQNIDIKDSGGKITVDQRQVLKIWEYYRAVRWS
jgi:hypothetical protein